MIESSAIKARFLDKISHIDKATSCWEWGASRDSAGYGQSRHMGRLHGAHRLSWMLFNGEITPGMHVMHRCDNPGCVNPTHLQLGTHLDNMRDCRDKGRYGKPAGARHWCAKLTDNQAQQVHILAKSGLFSPTLIAEEYGISTRQVHRIAAGTRWASVVGSEQS